LDGGNASTAGSGTAPAAEAKAAGKIPIREASGLALRRHGSKSEVLAIGDRDFDLAIGSFKGGVVADFRVIDLRKVLLKAQVEVQDHSQWEGIKCDASGKIFILEENPGNVFVFDSAGKTLLAAIELHFGAHTVEMEELKSEWSANPNSRGEGLAFLEHGHLLILKEKEPRRLIEFGPGGDEAVGLRLLKPSQEFALPSEKTSRMVPLASWKFTHESDPGFPDLSDMDVDEQGGLWVLSDEGRAIGRIKSDGGDERLEIEPVADLSAQEIPKKPEGLIVLDSSAALVVCDTPEKHAPLYSARLKPD